jgi:hypothetical protein
MDRNDTGSPRDREAMPESESRLSHTPGRLEDKETASARANRTGEEGVASLRPDRETDRADDVGAQAEASGEPGEHGDTRQAQQRSRRYPTLGSSADPMR